MLNNIFIKFKKQFEPEEKEQSESSSKNSNSSFLSQKSLSALSKRDLSSSELLVTDIGWKEFLRKYFSFINSEARYVVTLALFQDQVTYFYSSLLLIN